MEAAIAIVGTLLIAVIGWMLYHNSQCRGVEQRLTKLEEWRKRAEGER